MSPIETDLLIYKDDQVRRAEYSLTESIDADVCERFVGSTPVCPTTIRIRTDLYLDSWSPLDIRQDSLDAKLAGFFERL